VGVRHTETSLIVWTGESVKGDVKDTKPEQTTSHFEANQFYDAGDKGCAFGPMDEIAAIMQKMRPGQTLEIHATDQTVSVDLSAWCRMTGHQLVQQEGDHYLIQHK
jgi:tRNA 2-thiouridine synthesizing protein A